MTAAGASIYATTLISLRFQPSTVTVPVRFINCRRRALPAAKVRENFFCPKADSAKPKKKTTLNKRRIVVLVADTFFGPREGLQIIAKKLNPKPKIPPRLE